MIPLMNKGRIRTKTSGQVRAAGKSSGMRTALTPLAHTLRSPESAPRATPLDLFALARRKWLNGERLDIGQLANELGVGRATVFRWVGNRDLLHAEIISSLFMSSFDKARRQASGVGADRIADVVDKLLNDLLASKPLRSFLEHDPEYALRVLTSKSTPFQQRCTDAVRDALQEQAGAGHIRPAMDIDSLAYIVVRIAESFLYSDVISGRKPEIDKARAAIRILLKAEPEDRMI
jgi:AcrR family transcriptional regulator